MSSTEALVELQDDPVGILEQAREHLLAFATAVPPCVHCGRFHDEADPCSGEALRFGLQVRDPPRHMVDPDLVESDALPAGVREAGEHEERRVGVCGPAQLGDSA